MSKPNPQTTVVVILGASQFPKVSQFQDSPTFENSAVGFQNYLLHKFGLPQKNLLYLFDTDDSADTTYQKIGDFLAKRIKSDNAITDVIIYYVGHGGFTKGRGEYFLTLRNTREQNLTTSGYLVHALSNTLKGSARHLRKYLILDCCFAAEAFTSFQSAPLDIATTQTLDEFPRKGVVLLCAASRTQGAKTLEGYEYTMFSTGLLDVLNNGSQYASEEIAFQELGDLVADKIKDVFQKEAVRPEVHSPTQQEGDAARVPFFPNPIKKQPTVTTPRKARSLIQSCPECKGSGRLSPIRCADCNGSGKIRRFFTNVTCSRCEGRGESIPICKTCSGSGYYPVISYG